MSDELLWVEKYRPSTIEECILPEAVKAQALSMVNSNNMNHLLLCGGPGTGKTTLAKAMCREMNADYIMYNGSDGSLNLEELRENIADFAHTSSLSNSKKHKVIIIDEADGLDWRMQPALRNAMEKYSSNCRFILTCNYPSKIIEPIHSRCATIDYKFDKGEMTTLIRNFTRRCSEILKKEMVTFEVEALKAVSLRYFPDNRKILNELQRYASQTGCIDDGIIEELSTNVEELFKAIKKKDFAATKTWVANNNIDSAFNFLYKDGEKYLEAGLLPLWILKLGMYQPHHTTVPNRELNLLTALVEFMAES